MIIAQTLETLKDQPEFEPQPREFSLGISGEVHGAGSSTIAKLAAMLLDFDYCYAGLLYRKAAVEKGFAKDLQDGKGITVFASQYVVNHPEIDIEIEEAIIKRATQGSCVFEGKTAVVLAKAGKCPLLRTEGKRYTLASLESPIPIFTALLACDRTIAAQRVLVRKKLLQQNKDPLTASKKESEEVIKQLTSEEIEAQIKNSAKRMRVTRVNWNKLYGLSELEKDQGAFDLTIDTSYLTPEEVVATIIFELVRNQNIFPFLSKEVKQKIADEYPEISDFIS